MSRPEPVTPGDDRQALQERLAMIGVVISPSTIRSGTPVRSPLDLVGVFLSDAVIEARRENQSRP